MPYKNMPVFSTSRTVIVIGIPLLWRHGQKEFKYIPRLDGGTWITPERTTRDHDVAYGVSEARCLSYRLMVSTARSGLISGLNLKEVEYVVHSTILLLLSSYTIIAPSLPVMPSAVTSSPYF
jgi:hypothetical protein